jgi:hypothetical protein
MKSLLIAALLFATCLGTSRAVQQGAVDAAKSQETDRCEDGIGKNYSVAALIATYDPDTTDEFLVATSACTGSLLSLSAMCSPATDVSLPDTLTGSLGVYCSVMVINRSHVEALTLSLDQFVLSSNDSQYSPDASLIDPISFEGNLAHAPIVVNPDDIQSGLVAFAIPEEQGSNDLLLTWKIPSSESGDDTERSDLEILVVEREPGFLRALFGVPESELLNASSSATGDSISATSVGVIESLSGNSDSVSDPIQMEAGIYIVSSSYSGDSNFAVWVHSSSGESDLLVNEIGDYSGQATFKLDSAATVIFEVTGIGGWVIETRPAF